LRIVERNPDLVFIIDHMNVADDTAKAGKIPEAIAEVVEFAKHPNVQVKMSSIAHKSSQAYPFRDLTDHLKRVFDAFGPRRSFWGTDVTAVSTASPISLISSASRISPRSCRSSARTTRTG